MHEAPAGLLAVVAMTEEDAYGIPGELITHGTTQTAACKFYRDPPPGCWYRNLSRETTVFRDRTRPRPPTTTSEIAPPGSEGCYILPLNRTLPKESCKTGSRTHRRLGTGRCILSPVSTEHVQRKLAAILSADAVGFSRLMTENDEATVEVLRAHRNLIGGHVRRYGGSVVDEVGDNLLAEFPSVVDAVGCAIESQEALAKRNDELPEARRMFFRVGVHLGDVLVEGERIYGDGVNIAARLQALAPSGGISISGTVHEQVRTRWPDRCEDMGEQSLKNIAHPVRVFQIRGEAVPTADAQLSVPGFGGRPAIAVLAFDNLSGDPEQDYFADGISEDLITMLSCGRQLPVISRNSSFVYKGKAVDVKRIGRELAVRYVVEGSVRRAGNRVRVTAQLIDATTGHHVWAERFDRDLADIFAVQDEITETIARAIQPAVGSAEQRRALAKPVQNLDAWDLYQRALSHMAAPKRENMREVRALCEKAKGIDPTFFEPIALSALAHVIEIFNLWSDDVEASIASALDLAEQSVVLDRQSPNARVALGWACIFSQQSDRARETFERAIALNPSFASGYWGLGVALYSLGRADDAVAMIEKSIRLSPRDPSLSLFLQNLGMAHFIAGRYTDAGDAARRAIALKPDQPAHHRLLAACCGHLDQADEARSALAEMARLAPDFSLEAFRQPNQNVADDMIEGWRKAGWEG
jgi:adenylate cyclase